MNTKQYENSYRYLEELGVALSCVFVFLFALFSVSTAHAAELRFVPQAKEINVGQQFQVDLVLDTENKAINAIESRIIFPADLLELKEIRDGNSIINFWIERPVRVTSCSISCDLVFSGITPGGFSGESGLIFSLVFESLKEGQGQIEISDIKALLNDGQGTEASLSISNFQFLISKQIPIPQIPKLEIKDSDIPETFKPVVAKDAMILDGKYFLVFATQDKGSGINRYEVKESRQRFLTFFSRWNVAESPYVLRDQELRSYIFVKAVDNAGNERMTQITPQNPLYWYENYENWAMIIVGLLIAFVMLHKITRKGTRISAKKT